MTEEQNVYRRVLLTGATGFVGRNLYPVLRKAGFDVRCASRDPSRAKARFADRSWVRFDVDDPSTLPGALRDCEGAVYLIHSMGESGDYEHRERSAATQFARAAVRAGLRRIVYLGGVAPSGRSSKHLRSRLQTGQVLREEVDRRSRERVESGDGNAGTTVIELRAGMVVGFGSTSWAIVRDLAARLPVMLLPKWLENRSQPIAIDDVCAAIAHALTDPLQQSRWFDLPGPEILSSHQILLRIAELRSMKPVMIRVPVLTPTISSYWLKLITRADYPVARQLVEGLGSDLISDPSSSYWNIMTDHELVSLDTAARRALDAEEPTLSFRTRLLELAARKLSR